MVLRTAATDDAATDDDDTDDDDTDDDDTDDDDTDKKIDTKLEKPFYPISFRTDKAGFPPAWE
ncbi:TPA: hypothetical protein ACJKBV_002159 [Neisseria meningitidis]